MLPTSTKTVDIEKRPNNRFTASKPKYILQLAEKIRYSLKPVSLSSTSKIHTHKSARFPKTLNLSL